MSVIPSAIPDRASSDHKRLRNTDKPDAHPQYTLGTIGYAEVTANQGSITAEVDLTGLSVPVTVEPGRRIRITGQAKFSSDSAAGDGADLRIKEDTTLLNMGTDGLTVDAESQTIQAFAVETPSPGDHTYKLSASRAFGDGTITMHAASTFPAFILVEDIGPA